MTGADRQHSKYRRIEQSLIERWLVLCGWAFEWRSGAADDSVAAARLALCHWLDLGLGFALAEDGSRLFDPAEILDFVKSGETRIRDGFWLDHFVETGRNLVRSFHGCTASDGPPSPATLPPRPFRVRLTRRFYLDGIEPGRDLLLRLPVPVEDDALFALHVEDRSALPGRPPALLTSERLQWRLKAPEERQIELSAEFSFIAAPQPAGGTSLRLSAEERLLYTRHGEGLIAVTPRIADLAARIAGADPDDGRRLRLLMDFIIDHSSCGIVHYDRMGSCNPGEWVLDEGIFDCQLGCALLVALCRSLAIPARLISGYLLYAAAPTGHYWAEAFIDGQGWRPVDLACWDLSGGGTRDDWRACFFGSLDYRMKTEVFPRHFTGLSTVRLGNAWQILQLPCEGGVETRFLSLQSGRPIYTDTFVILP